MKTPEEIKKGIECCLCDLLERRCEECPYANGGCETTTCERELGADALALIRQLEAKVPKWISVEEQPPVGRVLAINDRGVMAIGEVYLRLNCGKPVYVCDEWDSGIAIIHVTHWMPLPSTEGLHDD